MMTAGEHSMNPTKLRLINDSNDRNGSEVLIFQKGAEPTANEHTIAWKVIRNLGQGWYHPFTFSNELEVSVRDADRNHAPHMAAAPGQQFAVTLSESGTELSLAGEATSPEEIQIANQLQQGAIDALVLRDGLVAVSKTAVAPGQLASFALRPTIFIGVVSQVSEGQVLDSAIVSAVNTEISLLGIASADIVMTGGGPGAQSMPFQFKLTNVVMA